MSQIETMPRSLIEAVAYFADERKAWKCFVNRRWPNQVVCPRCASSKVHLIETRMIWRCNGCTRQFSVKVGTIFEDSAIGFAKWLPAMWLIANAKNGVSSCELARSLGVTQKTAWHMLHRIRKAMASGTFEKLGGSVEVDESWIGGRRAFKHKHRQSDGPFDDKDIVLGILKRDGEVRTFHVPNTRRVTLEPKVRAHVSEGSNIYSDANYSYNKLGLWYQHGVIDHAISYVEGLIHTNGLENYWSLLKRTLKGTYIHVDPFHLGNYLDEQAFRYNARKGTDLDRFEKVMRQTINKRLTYNELTGKVLAAG